MLQIICGVVERDQQIGHLLYCVLTWFDLLECELGAQSQKFRAQPDMALKPKNDF